MKTRRKYREGADVMQVEVEGYDGHVFEYPADDFSDEAGLDKMILDQLALIDDAKAVKAANKVKCKALEKEEY